MHYSGYLIAVIGAVLLCSSACEAAPSACDLEAALSPSCRLLQTMKFGEDYLVSKLLMHNARLTWIILQHAAKLDWS